MKTRGNLHSTTEEKRIKQTHEEKIKTSNTILSFKERLSELPDPSENENENVNSTEYNSHQGNSNPLNSEIFKDIIELEQGNNNSQSLFNQDLQKDIKLTHQDFGSEFPIDHSFLKQIEIEIPLNSCRINLNSKYKNKKNENSDDEIAKQKKELLNQHFENNPIVYYEFTNSKAQINSTSVSSTLSTLDLNNFQNLYDHLYSNNNHKIDFEKDMNYIEVMSSVYQKFLNHNVNKDIINDFFYIVSPLICFYFFKLSSDNPLYKSCWEACNSGIKSSGLLISNMYSNLENKLRDYEIKIFELKSNNTGKTNSKKIKHLTNLEKFQFVGNYDELDQTNPYLISGAKDTNSYFNMIINDFEDNFFKIFTPFPFQSATYRTSKISIEYTKNEFKSCLNIKVKGCIFHYQVKEILSILEKEFSKYSIKLHYFPKTQTFFSANSKLYVSVEKVEYQDESYFFRNGK